MIPQTQQKNHDYNEDDVERSVYDHVGVYSALFVICNCAFLLK